MGVKFPSFFNPLQKPRYRRHNGGGYIKAPGKTVYINFTETARKSGRV